MLKYSKNIIPKNQAFNDFINEASDDEKIRFSRYMSMTASVVYLAFIIVDLISINDKGTLLITSIVRLTTVLIFLVLYKLSFYKKIFLKLYELLIVISYWLAGTSIILMMHLSKIESLAFNTYFAGLVLVIVSAFPFSYINTKLMTAVLTVILLEYIYVYYYLRIGMIDNHVASTLNHVLFMIGAFILGLIIDFQKKYLLFNSFKAQHFLKEQLLNQKNQDEVRSISIDKILRNAESARLYVLFKKVSSKNKQLLSDIESTIKSSLPINSESINIDKNTILIYSYFDKTHKSVIEEAESQMLNILATEDKKQFDISTYRYPETVQEIEDIISTFNSPENQSKVVNLK